MNIALFGYGGVGKAFVRLIAEKKDLLAGNGLPVSLICVAGRNGGICDKNGIDTDELAAFSKTGTELSGFGGFSANISADTVITSGITDLAVVATPTNKKTGQPGLDIIRKLLTAGINVVTADKGPVLLAFDELTELAKSRRVQFAAGCTAGGALPAVNGGMADMAGARIKTIEGIFNGTSNYILDRMEQEGISLQEALEDAVRSGIAEADPSIDIEGYDTAIKLLILAKMHMGVKASLDHVKVQGISGLTTEDIQKAKKAGYRYRLMGRAVKRENGRTDLWTGPVAVWPDDFFHGVRGKNKAVRFVSDTLGELLMAGGASGTEAAAAALLRDVININRGYKFVL